MSTDTVVETNVATETKTGIDKNNTTAPHVDIYVSDHDAIIYADLPGARKEDVKVEVNDENDLVIEAINSFAKGDNIRYSEFPVSDYYRSFHIDEDYDKENINGEFDNGRLKVTIKKKEEVQPKTITIN